MAVSRPPLLDMTPDGGFRPRPAAPIGAKVVRFAVLTAVLLGMLAVASLAVSIALFLIPAAIVAGLIAWGAIRFQLWRMRQQAGRGGRPPVPPGRY